MPKSWRWSDIKLVLMPKKKTGPCYKRILLKLSGEAMAGPNGYGIDPVVVRGLVQELREVHRLGVQIAIVMGGGNIFRGMEQDWMDRASADYNGMLATVINSLSLQDALEHEGVYTRVATAVSMQQLAEPYIRRRVIRHLEKGRIVILAGGTGNPYFSTDTAASLRAMEVRADLILKGTKVDGVYSADPMKDRKARFYPHLRYLDVLKKNLKVMDATAISLCMDNRMPIIIFNLFRKGNLKRVVLGEKIGTLVH